ncbi:glucokinase [Methylohalobius crimeensis]|uniref:glucokinase n=1 Tax=Methylohalobius crimeensis TaxID=244365 RepID=UPI0003B7958A|nr:glucokinase [Methylohalobius crimeensis]
MSEAVVLAADVGGTKTLLRLACFSEEGLRVLGEARFASADYDRFEDLLSEFVQGDDRPVAAACFGVAGPVEDGVCRTTNLPWRLDAKRLSDLLEGTPVQLLNDLEAAAFGILHLPETQLVELNPAARRRDQANRAVIAAGTGLGEALILHPEKDPLVVATEGGHCDFAPLDVSEDRLLEWLRDCYPEHVSYERILSGSGLVAIYHFLRAQDPASENLQVAAAMLEEDPAAVIGRWGVERRDVLCYRALAWFARIYGAEAGNLALKSLALGGVYVTGGIAPKSLPILQEGGFMARFAAKGRFKEMLRKVSVKVVLNSDTVLIGAQEWARSHMLRA